MKILITGKNSYIGTSFETWLKQYGDKYQVQSIDVKGEDWKQHDFSCFLKELFNVCIKQNKYSIPNNYQNNIGGTI